MLLRALRSDRLTPRARRAGFTLPEILIVIVMISVLALVAIPRFATANGKRHMESARMRVAAALATARQAAIQKGQTVTFMLKSNRITVYTGTDSLISPVPLDTLYSVRAGVSGVSGAFTVDFSGRGFATNIDVASKTIALKRSGVADDSVVITRTGMVQR